MDERMQSALALLPDYLSRHVLLSASALALGIALGLPLGLWLTRHPGWRWPVLALASFVQTIPGLALLALFYPLLLGLSLFSEKFLGFRIPALGFLPSLLALTLYSMLPILRNAVAGLSNLDPAVMEAADAVGMTERQRLLRVEVPLAAPVVMAGIRTAAVWTIGAATLSTSVGQTSLGNYIFSGLQTENWIFVLFGCATAAVFAFAVDQILGLIEAGAAQRQRGRIFIGIALIGAGAGGCPDPRSSRERIAHLGVVGAEELQRAIHPRRAHLRAARECRRHIGAQRGPRLGGRVSCARGLRHRCLCGLFRNAVDQRAGAHRHARERRHAQRADGRAFCPLPRDVARPARVRERLRTRHAARPRCGARRAFHR